MTKWWSIRGLWPGALALLSSLAGTLLIQAEGTRLLGVLWLLAAVGLGVLAWREESWGEAFPSVKGALAEGATRAAAGRRGPVLALAGIALSALLVVWADLALAGNPEEPFGPAGWLWLGGMALLAVSAYVWDRGVRVSPTDPSIWPRWEVGAFAGIVLLSLVLRVWDLRSFPNNIYPDEIMTGQVANGAFMSGQAPPSLFSTLWGGIDLPALWFFIVSRFQMAGGSTLEMLRLPGALFGAATVVPFYLMVRGVWGRWAAIGGAAIVAASASNLHYSRVALNNIVAPFFWALCFFFLLRAIRERRALDWALAGLSAGMSEHFYNGTRLLPFVLIAFLIFLLIFYWSQARAVISGYGLVVLGYLAGFGPLLSHFLRNPGLYFGRGTEMLAWKGGIPTSLDELGRMWSTLAPIAGDNLLGFSTAPSQDIIYFAPLLLAPEAALLVVGVALLAWKWKHPAAFLMLLSGLGVMFVGGTLVTYPNASFPQINHWTPAFPAIYAAIGIPIGFLARSVAVRLSEGRRWVMPAALGVSLAALIGWNTGFYFTEYKANAGLLRSENYRRAQEYYDVQTAQSRYIASLGRGYRVVWVGQTAQPYDASFTYALLGSNEDEGSLQGGVRIANPETELGAVQAQGQELAFILFPESEQHRPIVEGTHPGGQWRQVSGPTGTPLFSTYEVEPKR
jgi:4-amino-4-deoxy-L-arabinose transferase-like glycosyltransferase